MFDFDVFAYRMGQKAGGGSGGGTSADWNAKEGEAGYIKNRTHWEEESLVVVFDNQTFEFDTSGIANGADAWRDIPISEDYQLEVGKTYTVIWDGVTYKNLVCFSDDDYPTLGASYDSLLSGDSEYPFNIGYYYDGGARIGIGTMSPDQTHTISIKQVDMVVHKIDPKYLPDVVGSTTFYTKYEGDNWLYVDELCETPVLAGDFEKAMSNGAIYIRRETWHDTLVPCLVKDGDVGYKVTCLDVYTDDIERVVFTTGDWSEGK